MPSVNYLDSTYLWGGILEAQTSYGGAVATPYGLGADLTTPEQPFGVFSKLPLDTARCFIVITSSASSKHTWYFGVTDDRAIGGSLNDPYTGDANCYGVGGNRNPNSMYQWFRDYPTSRTLIGNYSPAYIGNFSVYIDPVVGGCWICLGSYGYDPLAAADATGWCFPDGGDPINKTDPTFTFPTTGTWYLDIRSSDNETNGGTSVTNGLIFCFDPSVSYGQADYDANWTETDGYEIGWKELVDNIGASTGIVAPILPVYLESIDNIFVGTGVLGPWYDQEVDDMTDIGTECGISLPFGYPYFNAPDTAVVSMILRAFEMEAYFGARAEFNLKPLYISSVVEKDINLIGSMSLRSLRIEATAKTDRDVNVAMTFKGLKINATMTKDKLIQGVLTLSALRTSAVMYEVSTIEGTFTLQPFELDVIGVQEIEHFVMRYER